MTQIPAKSGAKPTGEIVCAEAFHDTSICQVEINPDDFDMPRGIPGFVPPTGLVSIPFIGPLELEPDDKVKILELRHSNKNGLTAEVSSYIMPREDTLESDGKGNSTSRPQNPRGLIRTY